jgi:hypothetical protein
MNCTELSNVLLLQLLDVNAVVVVVNSLVTVIDTTTRGTESEVRRKSCSIMFTSSRDSFDLSVTGPKKKDESIRQAALQHWRCDHLVTTMTMDLDCETTLLLSTSFSFVLVVKIIKLFLCLRWEGR